MGSYRSWFNVDAHANGGPTETFLFVVQKVVWRTVSPSSPSSAAFQGSMKMRGQTPPRPLFFKPSPLRFPHLLIVRQTGFCRRGGPPRCRRVYVLRSRRGRGLGPSLRSVGCVYIHDCSWRAWFARRYRLDAVSENSCELEKILQG